MGRFGDFEEEESFSSSQKKCSGSLVILPKSVEISVQAWNKTIEKAVVISEFCDSISPSYLSFDLKPKVKNNDELADYLKELNLKNQKLMKGTKESIEKLYAIQKKKKEDLERKEEEDRKRKEEEKTRQEKEKKQDKEDEFPKEINHIKTEQVEVKTEEPSKISTNFTQAKNNQTHHSLHQIHGKVVSLAAYQEADRLLQVVFRVKNLKNTLNSNSIFKGKMSIRTRCGQFMNLQAKAKHLSSVLEDGKKESEDVYQYLMYLVAKQVVKQAETEIAVKKDLAFPIAIFCCMLMEKHKAFKDLLVGKMIKKCPYVVPMYIKKGNCTDAEYRKNLGYVLKEDKSYETEIQYEERMCGVLCLYAAIVQTTALPHSYGIQNGWMWLARILNLPVRRISAALILTFIEIAGYEMFKTYPRQMSKLMKLLLEKVIPKMPEASVASVTRLQLFMDETVSKTGTIPEPFGKYLKKK